MNLNDERQRVLVGTFWLVLPIGSAVLSAAFPELESDRRCCAALAYRP